MSAYTDLMNIANVGSAFKEFSTSNIGAYILKRAERDEIELLRDLAAVDSDNPEEIRRLQMRAALPKLLIEYIDEVIRDGNNAKWELEQYTRKRDKDDNII